MRNSEGKVTRRFGLLVVTAILMSPADLPAQGAELLGPRTPPAIVVTRLSDRALALHFEGPQLSNILALRSSQGIVVIDTESSPSLGAFLEARILEEFPGARVSFVVNTHGHGDHTWGNQAFEGAVLIGHAGAVQDMDAVAQDAPGDAERMAAYLERLARRVAALDPGSPEREDLELTIRYFAAAREGLVGGFLSTPPTITFSDGMTLHLGDLTLRLRAFPRAHSNSDVLVLCPEEGLLATGDLFTAGMRPPYLRTETVGELPSWIAAMLSVLDGEVGLQHVIPGHGDVLSAAELEEVRGYLVTEQRRIEGKRPALPDFLRIMEEEGTEPALARLGELAGDEGVYLLEADLVSLGYTFLYRQEAPAEAVRVFRALTELFPDSWNAWDCLGEAAAAAGDVPLAVGSYTRSLELNPDNRHAAAALAELRDPGDGRWSPAPVPVP